MTLYEVNDAISIVLEAAGAEANIIFGAVIDEHIDDEVRVTVIATGFDGSPERQVKKVEVKETIPTDYIGTKLDLLEKPAYQRREDIQNEILFNSEIESQFFNAADADDLEKPAFLRKQMD